MDSLVLFNKVLHAIEYFIKNPTLYTTITGAFVGAWSAYKLNFQNTILKEKQENLKNLNSAILILSNELNSILNLKKQLIKSKVDEIRKIFELIDQTEQKTDDPIILIESSSTIGNSQFEYPIDISKLTFITDKEPQLLFLIIQVKKEINSLPSTITEYNNFVDHLGLERLKNHGLDEFTYKELYRLKKLIDCMADTADKSLSLSAKAIKLMNKYGIIHFPNKVILDFNIGKEFQYLIPDKYLDEWDFDLKETFGYKLKQKKKQTIVQIKRFLKIKSK